MNCKIIASVASFLFILLLSFPSLGMENNNNVFEELEKELVEKGDGIIISKTDEVILPGADGFVVVIFPSINAEVVYITSSVIPFQHYLFLRYCSLLI